METCMRKHVCIVCCKLKQTLLPVLAERRIAAAAGGNDFKKGIS
jgi:hypothetical protein